MNVVCELEMSVMSIWKTKDILLGFALVLVGKP